MCIDCAILNVALAVYKRGSIMNRFCLSMFLGVSCASFSIGAMESIEASLFKVEDPIIPQIMRQL